MKDVLKPLINDLKFIMEEGIEKKITDINGQTITKKFKIAVSAVCGDNKGIYELFQDIIRHLPDHSFVDYVAQKPKTVN